MTWLKPADQVLCDKFMADRRVAKEKGEQLMMSMVSDMLPVSLLCGIGAQLGDSASCASDFKNVCMADVDADSGAMTIMLGVRVHVGSGGRLVVLPAAREEGREVVAKEGEHAHSRQREHAPDRR